MSASPSSHIIIVIIVVVVVFLFLTAVDGLGSSLTAAVVYGNGVICGIAAGEPTQRIRCYQNNRVISVLPNVSFQEISGGRSFFCGLRRGGFSLLCWDTGSSSSSFRPKRIYYSKTVGLTDLTMGDDQVCAREVDTGVVRCWRGRASGDDHDHDSQFPSPGEAWKFSKITCGSGFACGVLKNGSRVECWGNRGVDIGAEIQSGFGNLSMLSLVAGESHACGLTINGSLVCKGNNDYGQLGVPNSSALAYNEFSSLALGANFTCAIRESNGLVSCWGDENRFQFYVDVIANMSFEFVVAGLDFACGLTTRNLSVICWGPGWSNSKQSYDLPIGMVIPGQCVESPCGTCATYPDSETMCHGSGHICKSCEIELPFTALLPPIGSSTPSPSQLVSLSSIAKRKLLLAFLIVGLGGSFIGFWSIVYCLWTGRVRLFVNRTTEPNTTSESNLDDTVKSRLNSSNGVHSPERIPSEAYSQTVGRQISGVSKPETFSLSELASATNNFSSDNVIGSGSFGIVYRGKLFDGREVAIKRGRLQTIAKTTRKNFQEKESAFDSELSLLSRLHHKHLVSLVGFCEENDERLLVYDYMTNGSLHNHLHDKNNNNNFEKTSSVLNSWTTRIKIALDAARGIEYLHNYAVPPIIHRDIKSSNILLDSTWTGKVSDFGLSLAGPELGQHGQHVPMKAVGTVGYIDPEYYVLNVLTTKSDVYGLGVVMLELLTGKRAVFRSQEDGIGVLNIVDYVGRGLLSERGEVMEKVLDERVGLPEANEAEAVEVFAHTAMSCVRLEGKERPGMADVVASLERAFLLCQDSFSPATFS